MTLNKDQNAAVKAPLGKILVLAGAGSGKTAVIINRIIYLVDHLKIAPHNILGLTFTNKAAKEMKERVAKGLSAAIAKEITLCTFHSFCHSVLRKEGHLLGYANNFSIYNEREMQRLVLSVLEEVKTEKPLSPYSVLETLSSLKNKDAAIENDERKLLEINSRLNSYLKTYNAIDFDNLLFLTYELFSQNKEVLKKYQNRYQHILIDEYQDTNPIQSKIADLLAQKHLFVVGDDDQAIYGFRGSSVEHILDFKYDVSIKLEQNYRSSSTILEAANSVIKNNSSRHAKKLWSDKKSDEKIFIFHAPTEALEAEVIVNKAYEIKTRKNLKWKDIAILYRSNILSRTIEKALLSFSWQKDNHWVRGVPYDVYGGTEFYERSEIKDILAYLKVINNPKDEEALLRIINVPRRGISEKTLSALTEYNRKNNLPLMEVLKKFARDPAFQEQFNFQKRTYSGLCEFVNIIEGATMLFKTEKMTDSFKWLIKKIDYKKAIEEETKNKNLIQIKLENVAECLNALYSYENDRDATEKSLSDFLSSTLLSKENIYQKMTVADRLQLMTFHSSKGLEFPVCFLIGLEDHLLPHEKSEGKSSIEEERRLFYVAITRCKEHLFLSMSRSRLRNGKPYNSNPSRFLFEIPKELLAATPWK